MAIDHRFKVETRPYAEGIIEQEVVAETDGIRQTIWRGIMNTRDRHIREALIQLGWTPPPER
jgi:hypothetical protein